MSSPRLRKGRPGIPDLHDLRRLPDYVALRRIGSEGGSSSAYRAPEGIGAGKEN